MTVCSVSVLGLGREIRFLRLTFSVGILDMMLFGLRLMALILPLSTSNHLNEMSPVYKNKLLGDAFSVCAVT